MKKVLGFLCAVMLVFGMVGSAGATQLLTNGDFETGDFTGWTTTGNVLIKQAGYFAQLQGMDNYFALFGSDSTKEEGSLSQNFTLTGISEVTLSFDWAFDYIDWSSASNDTFVSLVSTQRDPVISVTLLELESSCPGGANYGHFERTYDLTPYNFTGADISFVLTEANTVWTNSLAGIDNVSVTGAPVPEPSTVLLLGLGLIGMAGYGRKRLSKKG